MADANRQHFNPGGPPRPQNIPPHGINNQGAFPPGPQMFQGPPGPMKGMQPGAGPPPQNMRPGMSSNVMAPPPMSRPGAPPQELSGPPRPNFVSPPSTVNNGPGSNMNGFGTPPLPGQNSQTVNNGPFHTENRAPPPGSMVGPPGGKFPSSGPPSSLGGLVTPQISQSGPMMNGPSQIPMSLGSKNTGPGPGSLPPRPMNTTQPSSLPGGPPPPNTLNNSNIRPQGGMMPHPGQQGPRPMIGGPPTSMAPSPRPPTILGPPSGPPTSMGPSPRPPTILGPPSGPPTSQMPVAHSVTRNTQPSNTMGGSTSTVVPPRSQPGPPMSGTYGAAPTVSGVPPPMPGGPPGSMSGPQPVLHGGPGQMPHPPISGPPFGQDMSRTAAVANLSGPPLPQGSNNQMGSTFSQPMNNQNARMAPSGSTMHSVPTPGVGVFGPDGRIPPPQGPHGQFSQGPNMTPPMSQVGANQMPSPYGQMPNRPMGPAGNIPAMNSGFQNMNLQDTGGQTVNLLQEKRLIPSDGIETPKPKLPHDHKKVNCSPDVFRCTLTSIPQSSSLLSKSRLPLGILIHPFKDLSQLPVIQSSVIVRCRSCRTYINPFVSFVDQRRWKCNLCYRINDLPDEFQFDPVSKTYGDPQRRPEIKSATIEFIAPSEYMLRPPQPAVYLYLLDVSFNAIETGYLRIFCQTLLDELEKVPKDSRTQVGFLVYDRSLHFFNLASGLSQPQMLIVSDLEDVFLPCPDDLLVNLQESKELVIDLLNQLPNMFEGNLETGSALGPALQAAYKLMSSNGGRVTVMQTVLPTVGPGALQAREDSSQRTSKNVANLGPAIDFYKKLALDCSAQQVAVDLFMLNGQYADLATVSCISKYSGGCVEYYPSFHAVKNRALADKYEEDLRRYFTRKIGFEAVMRIRCTKGLSIHTFHGNFFVRSTDLLSLPNINPDAGFGMQMSIEDSLTETSTACFQAALLYTSSKGERRIRVHTMCLPVTNQISDVIAGADQRAIVSLLAKMAADRSVTSSMSDAREALINAAIDSLSAFGGTLPASQRLGSLPTAFSIRLIPMLVLALLKSVAFRHGVNTRLDDRVFAMQQCKSLPLQYLIQTIYPDLYPVHNIESCPVEDHGDEEVATPIRLQLSSANVDRQGVYLLDAYDIMYLYVGSAISNQFCEDVFSQPNYQSIPDGLVDLPELDNPVSEKLRSLVTFLMDSRPGGCCFLVIKEESKNRLMFFGHLIEDRTESTMSYYEFLQHLQKQVRS